MIQVITSHVKPPQSTLRGSRKVMKAEIRVLGERRYSEEPNLKSLSLLVYSYCIIGKIDEETD
jgi:hypothetical protein